LVKFVLDTKYGDIPQKIVDIGKVCVFDALGNMIARRKKR